MPPVYGVITLDKPSGVGSNRVLSRLKRMLGVRKMGFLGTLDPLAQGVLPVFVGKATKLIAVLESLDKEYRVTLRLGERTDTFDTEGKVIERRDPSHLAPEQIREAILSFQGSLEQATPAYSAVKHGGTPAYRLARQGKPVPPTTRQVRLWGTTVEEIDLPEARFRVSCSSGTYMRSLVVDIGHRLGVGAVLTRLVRLRCGEPFRIEDAVTLETIESALKSGDRGFLLDPGEVLPEFHPYTVAEAEEAELRLGRVLPLKTGGIPHVAEPAGPPLRIKALRPCGRLVAIGKAVPLPGGGFGFQPTKVLI